MGYKEKKETPVCSACGKRMARIVPTKTNIENNSFLSKKTEVFLCFNYSCWEKTNFHSDKWWTWG